jgi:hypothetical protein
VQKNGERVPLNNRFTVKNDKTEDVAIPLPLAKQVAEQSRRILKT